MKTSKSHYRDLCELLANIETSKEADQLLEDLLTPQETESLTKRWQLVQMLAKGVPQRHIAKKLHVSISKVTRGSRVLQYGKGGFRHFLRKMQKPVTRKKR